MCLFRKKAKKVNTNIKEVKEEIIPVVEDDFLERSYKVDEEYLLREIVVSEDDKTYIVVTVGEAAEKLNGVIKLNETGADIFRGLQEGKVVNEIIDNMLKDYEVERDILVNDVKDILLEFKKIGAIK